MFNVALAVASLRNAHWTGLRAGCRFAVDLAGGFLFCWLMKANLVATLHIANLDPARTLAVKNAVHICRECFFPLAVVVSVVVAVIDARRIIRVNRRERAALAGGIPALD